VSDGPVVCNSSPLIALSHIGEIEILKSLFGEVLVPPAVVAESVSASPLPEWVLRRDLTSAVAVELLHPALGRGESEAICLAAESKARLVLLDDRPARRHAQALGLPVMGTLGILLAAKRRGLVPAVRSLLEALVAHGFRVAPRLLKSVLADAGEALPSDSDPA